MLTLVVLDVSAHLSSLAGLLVSITSIVGLPYMRRAKDLLDAERSLGAKCLRKVDYNWKTMSIGEAPNRQYGSKPTKVPLIK